MKLSKKIVITIIILLTAALSGLLCLQIAMLDRAADLELQTFRQNVNAALSSIIQKLETHDMLVRVLEVSEDETERTGKKMVNIQEIRRKTTRDSEPRRKVTPHKIEARIDSQKITFELDKPQRVRLLMLDSQGQELTQIVDELKPTGEHEIFLPESERLDTEIHIKLFFDSTAYVMHLRRNAPRDITILTDPASSEKRLELVERVLDEYTTFTPVPIENRINPAKLDTIVRRTLEENGIRQDYAYGIISAKKDSVILVKPSQHKKEILHSEFKTRLFPHDVFVEPNDLVLFFPQQRMAIFKRLGLSALSTLFFIMVIVFCFIYVIRAIFTQKRFSSLLVDFINNMTHEFKTPISTISLASETLTRPSVLKDEARLKKYGKIINDESSRMRNQVEKILEMAAIEEGDVKFNMSVIDVHTIILKAIDNFHLRLNKSKGHISTDLSAEIHIVKADAIHLSNIIHNLLDNAVKYTNRNPEIDIKTKNVEGTLKIAIQDNGIGLRPEEQKRVFDKYYRVPTGNIHDVKGFGLGLSYVKLMVEAHKGTVTVKSEPGKGSVFEITLPLCEDH